MGARRPRADGSELPRDRPIAGEAPRRARETAVEAVRAAVARGRERYLAMVIRRAGGVLDAEEILQEALERALERAAQLDEPARAEAWVGRVVRNVVYDHLRRPAPARVDLESIELAAEEAAREIDCQCVLAQAAHLKPEYAQILTRLVVDEAPLAEVARELGVTPNNAAVRLHRARRALERRLTAHCGTTSPGACDECGCEERGCCAA